MKNSTRLVTPLAAVLFSLLLSAPAPGGAAQAQAQAQAQINAGLAPEVDFLSPLERAVLAEVNLARANPVKYAAYLEELKPFFKGNTFERPGAEAVETFEGPAAVDDAIGFLRATQPLPPLKVARGLCSGARDHVRDLLKSGSTGHRGSDGSFVEQRVGRYGSWRADIGENIAYDAATAREIVVNWIVDDGSAKRGHRKNLFNPKFGVAGIAAEGKAGPKATCVFTYADEYNDRAAGPKKF